MAILLVRKLGLVRMFYISMVIPSMNLQFETYFVIFASLISCTTFHVPPWDTICLMCCITAILILWLVVIDNLVEYLLNRDAVLNVVYQLYYWSCSLFFALGMSIT